MNATSLSSYFSLDRRYSRSINLERDFLDHESLSGYVITERAEQTLSRILEGLAGAHTPGSWMLTGVYGTGKSAFAHFLSSLFSSGRKEMRIKAEEILRRSRVGKSLAKLHCEAVPEKGLLRAVVTARREPIADSVIRALERGVNSFWDGRSHCHHEFNRKLVPFLRNQARGKRVEAGDVLKLVMEVGAASGTGLVLIIDELGKCLEYAAQNRGAGDLYLLQQIAELSRADGPRFYLIGLLHQAFSEYGYGLGTVERNEWAKIQGRFEEIPFTESSTQMVHLIGQVIRRNRKGSLDRAISQQSAAWYSALNRQIEIKDITSEALSAAWPLHPVAAVALPQLCIRYAQNDRSLFTFLTSAEPHSLRTFLEERQPEYDDIPLLKLDRLYDYFVDSVGIGTASRPNFQRWSEVRSLVDDHRKGDPDELKVLKTIGILNLASTAGFLKASRDLVVLSLSNSPVAPSQQSYWEKVINTLIERGLVVHRQQVNELRIWEGSDFDVEASISRYIEHDRTGLATLLTETCPLRPLVAQRHSYRTGTLRFFERRYVDGQSELTGIRCDGQGSDGLLAYWVDEAPPALVPTMTADQRPFVLVRAEQARALRLRLLEAMALKSIQANAPELQSDGIARREVRYRLMQSKRLLDDAFAQSIEGDTSARSWIDGQEESLNLRRHLNNRLSELCDDVYDKGLTLWNELINRQELTSQGAKASRQVVAAMLEHPNLQNLGLHGHGPEVSIYHSLLDRTGIHRRVDDEYGFHAPSDNTLGAVWSAIEAFCLSAEDRPISLDQLYQRLRHPPFGVKSGVIPLLFAAVLLKHSDDLSLYKDGSFVPILGPEHFELLVKTPSRFSVKHYHLTGLRAGVFKELEDLLSNKVGLKAGFRNRTLLGIVTPLLQFVRRLPLYTQKTSRLSAQAQSVRQALLEASEPDKLLFELLPIGCGLQPISDRGVQDPDVPRELRARLTAALKELNEAYEELLSQCRTYVYEAFAVRQGIEYLREHLRVRASFLVGRSIESTLTRFVFVATDSATDDLQWLKSLVMVIADKPSESWTDSDADAFEFKLTDVARRFKHLEAIAADNDSSWSSQAEARRISVIGTDGKELHDVAWIDEAQRARLERLAIELLQPLNLDLAEQRALLAVMLERVLNTSKSDATLPERSRSTRPIRGRKVGTQ